MNQILVTEKLYITPELKQKKKAYKISFFLSIFSMIVLSCVYIYAEYDRGRLENSSQDILEKVMAGEMLKEDTTVAPTTMSGRLKRLAMPVAPSTNQSPPLISSTRPTAKSRTDVIIFAQSPSFN